MKHLFPLAFILISGVSFGQDINTIKGGIDVRVKRICTDTRLTSVDFSIQALKKVLHYINYQCESNQTGYVKITRHFSRNNDSTKQTFYLDNGRLIFATETIISYYTKNNQTDSIAWSGAFYFSKGKLIDYITHGHGKSEIESWNPEQEMLRAFNESNKDIVRYKKKKSGG